MFLMKIALMLVVLGLIHRVRENIPDAVDNVVELVSDWVESEVQKSFNVPQNTIVVVDAS